jgi:glycosyltransferase involved in cell wall biosynthesis
MNSKPSLAILMCTLNGEVYIKEQLDSIKNQDYKSWKLYVSDDGSSDQTLTILKDYQNRWGRNKLYILKGPGKNFQDNFLSIISNHRIHADLFFLSDQDDIWMPHKLSHTIKKFSKLNPKKPALYCGRTTLISSNGKKIMGLSNLMSRLPSFKNAIVQSIAGGNTMAFNVHLKNIVANYPNINVNSHDWWLYILNELFGGKTFYDKESTILYRQHSRSIIGSNASILAKFKRLDMLLNGTFRQYNSTHIKIFNLLKLKGLKNNLEIIERLASERDKSLMARLRMIKDLGLYRQSRQDQIALYFAAFLHKL